MENYEEMKAQVLTAIALAVTAEEIKAKDEIVLFREVAGSQSEITIVDGEDGDNFSANVLTDVEVPYYFKFSDLEKERERLLNKPEWNGAPDDAFLLGLDSNLQWYWHTDLPRTNDIEHRISEGGYCAGRAIAFPAGYDWKESLEFRPE